MLFFLDFVNDRFYSGYQADSYWTEITKKVRDPHIEYLQKERQRKGDS